MSLNSWMNRGNAVVSFFSSVFFGVLAVVAVTGPMLLYSASTPTVNVNMAKASVKMGRLGYYYDAKQPMTELATVHFDLKADLTPLFNWNTKQLFVMLVAEYETDSHEFNQVTLWDDIISSKDEAMLKLKRKKCEYPFSDISHKVGGLDANLTLQWDIMPYVGLLIHDKSEPKRITLPTVEEKKLKKQQN
ncbi:Signal peptidase complex subunit [Podochytrium sp. JEL0797]|nr:Signal peptidase complex subunit [Podochytrium sp. JEL0797]